MKWLISICLLCIIVSPASGAFDDGPLLVGIRPDNGTIEYATKEHRPAGLLVDLWNHWASQQKRQVEFVFVKSGSGAELLKDGTIDVLANSPNDPSLALSEAYFCYDFYLISLRDAPRHSPSKFPLTVGIRDTDFDYLDHSILSGAEIKKYRNYSNMLVDLNQRDLDYLLANDIGMNIAINGLNLLPLNYPDKPFLIHQIKAAVGADHAAFLHSFNTEMAATVATFGSRVARIWLPGTIAFRMSWSLIGFALIIVLVSAVAIIIWFMNAKLKEEVKQATEKLVHEQDLLREAKDKATDSELYIRNLIDAIHVFIIAVNDIGNITHLNRYATRFIIGKEPCRNRSYLNSFPFLNPYSHHLIDVLEKKKTFRARKINLRLNSDKEIVANLGILPFVVSGKAGALLLIEDISEVAKKDELLLQSQKFDLIQSLTGGVAHDFNNILAIISGSANLLKRQVNKGAEVNQEKLGRYLDNILNATEKGVATTKALASLSGRVSVDVELFSMNDAVKSILNICTTTMDKSVQVQYLPPQQKLMVNGNRGLLEQAIINVVINAYHAMTIMRSADSEQGGLLTMSFQLTDGGSADCCKELCLIITDTGVGIPEERLQDVFTPFYTTKEKGTGTGLGLAMVHNSLQHHDGRIEISSVFGEGTEVRLFLPCVVSQEDKQNGSITESDSGDAVHNKDGVILLADDNDAVRESLAENLMLYGYQVIQAKNGAELVSLFRNHQRYVDVVVTDLEMPEMTGDQAFDEIRKIDGDAKVIISSGFLEDKRITAVFESGVDDFIQKPCVISELVAKIEGLKDGNILDQALND